MSDEPRKPPFAASAPPAGGPPPLPGRAGRRTALGRESLLSPAELEQYGDLLLFARATVEGYFAGKHASPHRGTSVEFTDYKEYMPGDDLHRIDWRAYGRSRRLFVRQYEAETDMVLYLLVDVSASMGYRGGGSRLDSKYVLAARVAAALAYLMIRQGDKVALALFANKLRLYQPPGGTRAHLHNLLAELETVAPSSATGIPAALVECDTLFKKRGRLIVLSDFWDDTAGTLEAVSRFVHRKFEVLLLHIVHPHEMNLPAVQVARFHDMETNEEVQVDPEEIRAAYRDAARARVEGLAREAHLRGISHALVRTDQPYLDAIEAYIGFRGTNTMSTR